MMIQYIFSVTTRAQRSMYMIIKYSSHCNFL